ncbi:hypothetical protein PM3016_4754 [Paenibacillus mucilaginosus 3016]|uniref:Uncharacterized protein n=2 Tax=Paenibacillus mucilaginosus TaxID=61624 RepID=H6NI91_9BACL|nr:hypothetical protein [Paenibacillus mucilaginosus]AFC31494.1 hypothetical protein PM3016_4754 [Paenibacillus mucilaginosus 3016]AFH63835.2 hypothetical protein B2K_24645 [Paenibacillus mucilaginosus K02]WFA20038.1 hypothetical protein ERY13_23775 [Paenibacillus mucilaginosus]
MSDLDRRFHYWLENGTLIYASFVRKGERTPVKLWGRVMKYEMLPDGDVDFVLYNDDSKESQSIRMSRLDDFQAEEEPDVQYVTYYPGQGSQVVSSIHGTAEPKAAEESGGTEAEGAGGAPAGQPVEEAAALPAVTKADELREIALGLTEADQALLLDLAKRLASR